jgi:hypothetical protein
MKLYGFVMCCVTFFGVASHASAQDEFFFSDSFESGRLVPTEHSSFSWSNYNNTSIVTGSPTARVLDGSDAGLSFSGKDWTARLGSNALRHNYRAGEAWSEQRFTLGRGLKEVWVKFDLRVPTNFTHASKGSGISSNNKIFYIWMDDYSNKGKGATVGWEYWQQSDGISELAVNIQSDNAKRHTGHRHHFDFINSKADRGRWMSMIFHLKTSSQSASADGVVSLYRKWDDEADYTRYHHVTDAILPSDFGGFHQGYLMGWHNGHYAEDTEWLIDNFIISEKNLLTRRPVMPQ